MHCEYYLDNFVLYGSCSHIYGNVVMILYYGNYMK
jgi:hypothetical protein